LYSSGSTLVLTRVPGFSSQLQLVDCLNPQVKQDSFFGVGDSFSNLRLPIFLVALGLVILYQIKQNRKEEASEDDGQMTIAQRIVKKAGGKLNSKARADLAQIDAMEKNLRSMATVGRGGNVSGSD